MITYLTFFGFSTLFLFLKDKFARAKFVKVFFVLLSMALLSFLAAFRDTKIGTDTIEYINCFETIKSLNFQELWIYIGKSSFGYLFPFFAKCFSFFSNDYKFFLGASCFITFITAYVAIGKMEFIKFKSITFLIFVLLFYNFSLNGLRQTMAMSFSLLSIAFWQNKSFRASLISFLVSFLLHNICILTIVVLLVGQFFSERKHEWLAPILFILLPFVLYLAPSAADALIRFGAIDSRYSLYTGNTKFYLNYRKVIVYLFPIALIVINFKYLIRRTTFNYVFIACFILEVLFTQLTDSFSTLYRVSLFFSLAGVILFSQVFERKDSRNIFVFVINKFVLVYYFVWWWYYYIYLGISATANYIFAL